MYLSISSVINKLSMISDEMKTTFVLFDMLKEAHKIESSPVDIACNIMRCLRECDDCFDTSDAAKKGHLGCLKCTYKKSKKWFPACTYYAAQYGHLNCLTYAHKNGCPWDDRTCTYAVRHGQLECLKYAHENGCPWNINTYRNAVHYKHMDCVAYLCENGCPRDEIHTQELMLGGTSVDVNFYYQYLMSDDISLASSDMSDDISEDASEMNNNREKTEEECVCCVVS